jgi:glycosyltransferase involved in cell wall biosynthesis
MYNYTMKIRLIGPRNTLGIGIHFSKFVDTIKCISGTGDIVEEIDSTNQDAMLEAAGRSQPDDVNICFVSINLQPYFKGTNIQWIVFESTRVPEIVMNTMLVSDLVWVPSEWGRQTLIANGMSSDQVDVVPEGVSTDLYHPYFVRPANSVTRFLTLGKFEERKSHMETVLAWASAFGNDPDVELVIKTDHFVNVDSKKQSLDNFLSQLGLHNVRAIWDKADSESIVELYRSADVFVLPSKGEGWGLPIIEAAATGLPIITTFYSGQQQYLQHIQSSVLSVDYKLGGITCPEFQHFYPTKDGNFGSWAKPAVESIAHALKTARKNCVALKQQAVNNAEIIRAEFSWARCADRALKTLQNRGLLS